MSLKKLREFANSPSNFDVVEIPPEDLAALLDLVELQHEAILWNWGGEPLPTKEIEALESYKELNKD